MASRIEQSIENNPKIEYNKNGNLNKYKSSTLFNQMIMKGQKGVAETLFVNDYNYKYYISKDSENNYDILFRIKIDGNEDFLNEIERKFENDKRTREFNGNTDEDELQSGYDTRDNAYDEGNSWGTFIDRILQTDEEQETNTTTSNGTSDENSTTKWIEETAKTYGIDLSKEQDSSFSNETKYSISTKDSNGRTLTKQQQEYFKDSKATDENGNLEVVYHGSNKAGFTVFNKNYNYYSNNKSVSQTYTGSNEMVDTKKLESISDAKSWLKGIDEYSYINGNTVYDYDGNVMLEYNTKEELLKHLKRDIQIELGNTEAGGIYEGYVDIKNPLVVNCNGDKWSAIDINGIEDNLDSLFEEFGASTFKENGAIRTTTSDITSAVSEALDEGALDYDGKHDNRGKKGIDTNIGEGRNTSNINKQTKQGNEQIKRRSTDRFGSENTLSKNQNEQGTYRIEEENIEGRNIKRVQITDEKVNDEIQHYNQFRNDFETGTSTGKSLEDMVKYVNSLGEIDSTDTQQRIGMTQKELQQESPESSKGNPVHPKTNELIQKRINELANNKNDKYNKKKGRGVFEEEVFENSQKVKDKNDKFDKRNENNGIELDNSSFSLDKLPKVKEGYTRLYRGLNNDYDVNYDRSTLDSPNGYDTLTDNYELANLQFVFLWYTYARGV